ncbi:DUF2155 domain-containing protein [Phenylobacterium sp. LjRoot219]|uniref:DUF2155 domain-containing protein n=1 Tax=Phenylobacterium sp. LjRoot219 TaxID=3342283 RepID=UPI003ECF7328
MTRSSAIARTVKRSVWLASVAAVAVAGLVSAQPVTPPAPLPGLQPAPPPGAPGPVSPEPEEAPPQEVPTPAPVVVPPISEKEIEPAPPSPAVPEKPPAPIRRARYDVAVLEALDKITAETLVFEAPVGKAVRFKGLIFTVRACERSTAEEPVADSIAYLTIDSQPRAEAGKPTPPARQVFKGWMYASAPGLHPLQHPVYDAWVISCRAAAPAVASR